MLDFTLHFFTAPFVFSSFVADSAGGCSRLLDLEFSLVPDLDVEAVLLIPNTVF